MSNTKINFFIAENIVSENYLKSIFSKNAYNKSYIEAGRRLQNRSILGVCEDFAGKPDAKRALLGAFLLSYKTIGLYLGTNAFIAIQLARYATAQNEKAII